MTIETRLDELAYRPFVMVSGRVFTVGDCQLLRVNWAGVTRECEYYLFDTHDYIYYTFIVRFFYTAFAFNRLHPEDPRRLIELARDEIWSYLDSNRQPHPKSRRHQPVFLTYYGRMK